MSPPLLSLPRTVMGGCSLEDRSPTGWSSPLVGDESSLDYGFDDNPRPPPFVLVLVRNHRRSTIARVPDNGRETTTSLVISFILDTFRKTEGGIERGEERWEESKIVSLLAYIFYIYIYIFHGCVLRSYRYTPTRSWSDSRRRRVSLPFLSLHRILPIFFNLLSAMHRYESRSKLWVKSFNLLRNTFSSR